MAIRNVVTRGYGAGAAIGFVVTRGYSIGFEPTWQDTHTVKFRSESSAVVVIRDTPQPLGFFLTEAGNNMVQESGLLLALESTLILQRIDFKSAANARTVIVDTVSALGFILTEDVDIQLDGGILQQENNLPIAQE